MNDLMYHLKTERETTLRSPAEATILVVDDSPLDQKLLEAHLEPRGYSITIANDGVEAMQILESGRPRVDVVLLDRHMPRMGGMEVLQRVKADPVLRLLPIIMQTAAAEQSEIVEGLRAGAYYYLTKPYDSETLMAIVETAARDYANIRRMQDELAQGLECLGLLRSATFVVRTLAQARDTAATLANLCPDPASAVVGLTELLVNGIEHGNLGITYDEKSELNRDGTWETEIERRLALPENHGKTVSVTFERMAGELAFTIRDEGGGFEWSKYLEIDPRRAFDNHGRGIVISRNFSFSSIEYRGVGNEVVARVAM